MQKQTQEQPTPQNRRATPDNKSNQTNKEKNLSFNAAKLNVT